MEQLKLGGVFFLRGRMSRIRSRGVRMINVARTFIFGLLGLLV
jgi:hypothetical protein